MKLRIKITGPRVHEVGYRYFLMSKAMSRRIRKFEAHNIESEGEQEVEVLVEGDEEKVDAFKDMTRTKWPRRAEVSRVSFEDYDGDVMRIGEYAQFCTTVQLDKAIPVLLDMRDDLKAVKEDTGSLKKGQDVLITGQADIADEIRALRDDLASRDCGERLVRMEKDIRTIKSKLSIR